MAFSLTSDTEFLKKLPAYTPILKTVLKSQIQLLVNQLSEHGGEESVFLTASMTDGTLSHIGSKSGQAFLESHEEFKSKFLHFCLGRDTVPVNVEDLQTQASKKMSNKQQNSTKRKPSGSFICSGAKKFKTPGVLSMETDSGNTSNINICSEKTSIVFPETSGVMCSENSKNICCQLKEVLSTETCTSKKEFEENPEKVTNENSCFKANSYLSQDVFEKHYKNSNSVNDSVDETDDVDETDNGIKEEGIIIKIEPGWDSENEGETTNSEEKASTEGTSDVFLSNSEKALSCPSTSSGISSAHLQADFLCCNDELIWEKNSLPKQKRIIKSSSLWTKYSAIQQVEQGEKSKTIIAEELGIPRSTLSTWLKHSDKIKADIKGEKISPYQKKRRFSNHYEIEEALLEWLKIVHLQGVVPKITSVNICDKANQLAKQFGYSTETFQCTKAWVERFKTRHGFKKNFVRGDNCSGD